MRFGGISVAGTQPNRRNLGMLFQNYALFPQMKVRDNVAYLLRMQRRRRAEHYTLVATTLEADEGIGEAVRFHER